MPTFDFIASRDFRNSLERDYAEMSAVEAQGAWKSVQVLAGSIIEALLVDYLVASNDPPRAGKDLLRLDLAEAIAICQGEGILSTRSAELSSVVRSYRNLIHPARLIRLGEAQPSRQSATIAIALVDVIVDEVAKRRQEKFGFTAEQVFSKIERDSNCLPLLKHLLTEVSDSSRERLLLELIPDRYIELKVADDDDPFSEESAKLARFQKAFRLILELSAEPAKQQAAAEFVRVLREADGDYVTRFQQAFFIPEDIQHVAQPQRAIVKEYFLSLATSDHTPRSGEHLAGLAPYLAKQDIVAWADPYVRTAFLSTSSETAKANVQKAFLRGFRLLPSSLEKPLKKRLRDWEQHFLTRNDEEELSAVRHLQQLVENAAMPS
ncbi:MAG: hypothetical protein V4813_13145 [Gemmatimonadota bacterium]